LCKHKYPVEAIASPATVRKAVEKGTTRIRERGTALLQHRIFVEKQFFIEEKECIPNS
jgi:hypothetical protein